MIVVSNPKPNLAHITRFVDKVAKNYYLIISKTNVQDMNVKNRNVGSLDYIISEILKDYAEFNKHNYLSINSKIDTRLVKELNDNIKILRSLIKDTNVMMINNHLRNRGNVDWRLKCDDVLKLFKSVNSAVLERASNVA
jgi:hypothetical protein